MRESQGAPGNARRSTENRHLRRMWALSYVIPKRKTAAQVWFAEARALLSGETEKAGRE